MKGKAVDMRFFLMASIALICSFCNAELLFEDNFDDGNADGWCEECYPSGASFWVESGWYCLSDSGSGMKFAISTNGDDTTSTPHQMSVADYVVRCKVTALAPTEHLGVLVRFVLPAADLYGYSLVFNYPSNFVAISKWISGTEIFLVDTFFQLEHEEEYWVRFDCIGDLLLGKVWSGTLADEPAEFLFQVNDSQYTDPGAFGVGGHCFVQDFEVAFDSVFVEAIPASFESCTWGGVKYCCGRT